MKTSYKSISIEPKNISFIPDKDPMLKLNEFRVEINRTASVLRNLCFQRVKDKHLYQTKHFQLRIGERIIKEDEILNEQFLKHHKIFFEYDQESAQMFDTENINGQDIQVTTTQHKQIQINIVEKETDKLQRCLHHKFDYEFQQNEEQIKQQIKIRLYREGLLYKAYQKFDFVQKENNLVIKYEDLSRVVLFVKNKGIIDKADRNTPFYKLSPDEFIEEYKEDNTLLVKITGKDRKMITKDYIDISEKNNKLTFQNLTEKLYLEVEIIKLEFQSNLIQELELNVPIELKLIDFCTKNRETSLKLKFNIYNNIFDLENQLKLICVNQNMKFYKTEQDYIDEQKLKNQLEQLKNQILRHEQKQQLLDDKLKKQIQDQITRIDFQLSIISIYGLRLIRELLSSKQLQDLEGYYNYESQSFCQQFPNNSRVIEDVVSLQLFVSL